MIKYAWASLKHNGMRSILFILALIAIFTVSTISLHLLLHIQAQVETDITANARGSYDVLVRPRLAQTETEQLLGLVEENYLGTGAGGITLKQWENILSLPEIELAAPVASLGYFTGFSHTVTFPFPETSSLIRATFTTSDGIKEYPFAVQREMYFLEQDGYYDGFEHIQDEYAFGSFSGSPPYFMIPQTFHLLLAIDMEQEEKLTGLNLDSILRPLTKEEKALMGFVPEEAIIKVLRLKDPNIPVKLTLDVMDLPWGTKDTIELKEKIGLQPEDFLGMEKKALQVVKKVRPIHTKTIHFPLTNHITPFDYNSIALDYEGNKDEVVFSSQTVGESTVYYRTKPVDYQVENGQLKVKQVGQVFSVPIYRELEKVGQPAYMLGEIPFALIPVGEYSAIEYQHRLAASPLGIYTQSPVKTADGMLVYETAVAGSFIPSPAHGLIQLEDAVKIKGEAPIDAIRIKVANITEYNDKAVEKILHSVEKIHQLGEFHIDIVAGASPKTIEIDVEGIGTVTQQWTSLGAAATIKDGWNITNVLISSLFILVGISYLLNRIFFYKKDRETEEQLLLDLGWKKQHVLIYHLLELMLMMVVAAITSLFIIGYLIYKEFLDQDAIYLFSIGLLLLAVVMLFLGIFPFKNRFTIKQGAPGRTVFMRNLYYYRSFIRFTFTQLMMVTTLVVFVISSIWLTYQETSVTNLGSFVNHTINRSLMLILFVAFLLAVITIIESNSSFLVIRKEELLMLSQIGWKKRHIQSLCLKELAVWSLLSIALGMGIGMMIVIVVYQFSLPMVVTSVVIGLLLYMTVLGTSFLVIRSQIAQISRII